MRKLAHQQDLESGVEILRQEVKKWSVRYHALDSLVRSRGVNTPNNDDDGEESTAKADNKTHGVPFTQDQPEEGLQPPGPNAAEQDIIEWKRHMNTLAARISRQRKLALLQELQNRVETEKREIQKWTTKYDNLVSLAESHGIEAPTF
jgi:hypothetical protein